jgi:hypothetical protein
MPKTKIITICSSASFYRQVVNMAKQLEKIGFVVKIPLTAERMKKSGDFNVDHYKTWFKNPKDYRIKTSLMKHHFKKVDECDAILVLNYEKRGISGYIGGNVLMEMTLAFWNKKPIYILNPISEDLNIKEEVLGLAPKFLNGDLTKIK